MPKELTPHHYPGGVAQATPVPILATSLAKD
jgi:hypothetical protein